MGSRKGPGTSEGRRSDQRTKGCRVPVEKGWSPGKVTDRGDRSHEKGVEDTEPSED